MQINVKGKHLEITEAIDAYVRKKAERLTRYFDKVQSIDCVIEKENNGYHDLYAAIDLAVDREARVLSDHKQRTRDHKHHH